MMWRDRYSATGGSPALQAVDSKQAENVSVGKTKSYWTNNTHSRRCRELSHTSRTDAYLGLIFVILFPWIPSPAISPFWPKMKA